MNENDDNAKEALRLADAKIAVALSTTFYFRSHLYADHEAVIACLNEYLDIAGSHLSWYCDTEIQRYRKATPAVLNRPIQRLLDPAIAGKNFKFHMQAGDDPEDASPYLVDSWTRMNPKEDLSYFRFSLPVDHLADATAYTDLVQRWAARLNFYHGYGGLTANESLELSVQQHNSKYTFALAKRFLGIEVEDSALTAGNALDSIKGVNWLTLISDHFVTRLGGEDALRENLGATITVMRVPAGLIIQAGKEPRAGDVNAEEPMDEYRRVARVLKPIRLFKHPGLGPREFGGFGPAGTAAWLRRFDD